MEEVAKENRCRAVSTVTLVTILPIIQLKVGECVREYMYELMIRSPAIESPFSP